MGQNSTLPGSSVWKYTIHSLRVCYFTCLHSRHRSRYDISPYHQLSPHAFFQLHCVSHYYYSKKILESSNKFRLLNQSTDFGASSPFTTCTKLSAGSDFSIDFGSFSPDLLSGSSPIIADGGICPGFQQGGIKERSLSGIKASGGEM